MIERGVRKWLLVIISMGLFEGDGLVDWHACLMLNLLGIDGLCKMKVYRMLW